MKIYPARNIWLIGVGHAKGGAGSMNREYMIVFMFLMALVIGSAFAFRVFRIRRQKKAESLAKEDMTAHLAVFAGYYQALYDAVANEDTDTAAKVLDVWKKRMDRMPCLQIYFSYIYNGQKGKCYAGGKWIAVLHSWGIMQDHRKEFSVSSDEQELYVFDDVYETGDMAEVIVPAWFYDDGEHLKCIERGAAKVKEI